MNRPIVLFAALWVLGYILAFYLQLHWFSLLMAGILLFLLILIKVVNLPGWQWIGCILIIGISMGYYEWHDQRNVSKLLLEGWGDPADSEIQLEGHITSIVQVDGDRVSFVVKANEVRLANGNVLKISEKMQVSVRLLQLEEQTKAKAWGRGDQIALQGTLRSPSPARNFGGFDYNRYLYFQQVHWMVAVKGGEHVRIAPQEAWGKDKLLRWNDWLRDFLGRKIDGLFSEPHAGFMKSLLIGLREDLDSQQFQQFSQLGLTHILAISGLHVAVFVGGCMGLMRWAGVTKETNLLLCMGLIPFYILLSGASPSVVRAGLMAIIALYAARRNILKDGLHLVSGVGVLMLMWNPYYLFDVSFQLSFLVTIGLIIGAPRFGQLLPIQSKLLHGAISVTTVAQVISFPISIYYFNQFSLMSWLANLCMVPLISFVVLPLGSISLLLGLIWIPLGSWLAFIVTKINVTIFWIVDIWNGWGWFHSIWPSPGLVWIVLYFMAIVLLYWSWLRWINLRMKLPLYLSIGCMFTLLCYGYNPIRSTAAGQIQFMDVGQGDSILIRTPSQKIILIDGGGTMTFHKPGEEWKNRKDPYEVGKKLLVPLLKKRGIHHIDYLLISHEDTDHIGGLQAVIEQIPVRHLLFNGTLKPNIGVEKFFRTALAKQIPLFIASEERELAVDKETSLFFISPQLLKGQDLYLEDQQNKRSVVVLLRMFASRFLFAGDISKTEELNIIKKDFPASQPSIDVLKVAHHGSKTSTSEEWVQYWKPKQAVISVGEFNTYGHPNDQVLHRLRQHQTVVYRTDAHGEVQMEVTPDGINVKTKLPIGLDLE